MRTALYLSAILAAMNFAPQTSAVVIGPTELRRQENELSQVYTSADTLLDADAEVFKGFPTSVGDIVQVIQHGSNQLACCEELLRDAIEGVLKKAGAGDGPAQPIKPNEWSTFANGLKNLNARRDSNPGLYKPMFDKSVARLAKTLKSPGGWKSFVTHISSHQ